MTDTVPATAVQVTTETLEAQPYHARSMDDAHAAVAALAREYEFCPPGTLVERDAARARVAELEGELAAAESTIRVLEDPELRAALTTPTTGDYGPVPHPTSKD